MLQKNFDGVGMYLKQKTTSVHFLISMFLICAMFGANGCGSSADSEEKITPKKTWVDIRGTEAVLLSDEGVKLCLMVPNGVFAVNHNDNMSIKFADFNDFSESSTKHPINFKVGVSSIFIRPESIGYLNNLKARLLMLGDTLIFSLDGFEVFKSKIGDDKTQLVLISAEKTMHVTFYPGRLIRDKYNKEAYLTKLITEISAATHVCK